MILIAFICLTIIFMPIMYTIHKYGECMNAICAFFSHISNLISQLHICFLPCVTFCGQKGTLISSKMASNYTDSSLSTSAFTMFHRSGGPSVHPIGISHAHLSSTGDPRDMRPILDNLSTSSTSTNNDSFLGAVNSNPTSRLLLGPGGGGKGRKKDSKKLAGKLLLPSHASKSGQMRDQMHQPIFSPQTASYHC